MNYNFIVKEAKRMSKVHVNVYHSNIFYIRNIKILIKEIIYLSTSHTRVVLYNTYLIFVIQYFVINYKSSRHF